MDRGAIEILSSTNSRQINLSRCCQEFVDGKSTSMDRTAIEKLSAKQNLSRWIENLSRSYREKFQKASMDQKCVKIYWEKKSNSLDRQLSIEKLSSLIKTSFSKRGKKHKNKYNQASYSNKNPNNILSSQKHLLTQKCKAFMIQNTHTKQV